MCPLLCSSNAGAQRGQACTAASALSRDLVDGRLFGDSQQSWCHRSAAANRSQQFLRKAAVLGARPGPGLQVRGSALFSWEISQPRSACPVSPDQPAPSGAPSPASSRREALVPAPFQRRSGWCSEGGSVHFTAPCHLGARPEAEVPPQVPRSADAGGFPCRRKERVFPARREPSAVLRAASLPPGPGLSRSLPLFSALTYVRTNHRSNAPFTPRVLLCGPMGSGKSLQAALLAQEYGLVHGECLTAARPPGSWGWRGGDRVTSHSCVYSECFSASLSLQREGFSSRRILPRKH